MNDQAFDLVVIGAGAIGLEFASFYNDLGSKVTLLKAMQRQEGAVTVTIEIEGRSEQLSVDRVLLAMGVVGNVENLGLEKTEVQVEKGTIKVDRWLQTDQPGIYAIGDVTGAPCLAHKASHEAVICVEKIAGIEKVQPLERERIPYCTYSHPQVANVGLTEAQARARVATTDPPAQPVNLMSPGPGARGNNIKIGKFPFTANGKAIAHFVGCGEARTASV